MVYRAVTFAHMCKHIERRKSHIESVRTYRVWRKTSISSERQRAYLLYLYGKTYDFTYVFCFKSICLLSQTRYFCVTHKIDIFALQIRYDMNFFEIHIDVI